MKTILYAKYESPDVLNLTDVHKPKPGDDEILIRIYAATFSSADCRLRKADPFAVRFINGVARPKKKLSYWVTNLREKLKPQVET